MSKSTKPLRAVLVGCGGMSSAWIKASSGLPDLQLVGLVDICEENASKRAAEHGLRHLPVGADLQKMLKELRPDIVFNCTIPEAHTEVTLMAFEHGAHVLGEKPLADSMENARLMLAAAENSGLLLAIIQNRRYIQNVRRLQQFLSSGAIGRLTTVNSDFYIGAHFGGFRDRMKHVLLLDMAIHTFDMARFLAGADPVSVYCREWNPDGSWYDHDASAIAVFEMENGLVYCYRGSWCAEGMNTSWQGRWRFIGENGSLTWDGEAEFHAERVVERSGFTSKVEQIEVPEIEETEKVGGHSGLIREFVRCIQEQQQPETSGFDNIKSLSMVFGAIESAETGRAVVL